MNFLVLVNPLITFEALLLGAALMGFLLLVIPSMLYIPLSVNVSCQRNMGTDESQDASY